MRQALALGLMVLCLGFSAPMQAKDKGDALIGAYTVEGKNAEGKAYTGAALIERYDVRYKVQWAFPDESGTLTPSAIGIGIVHEGKLSIAIFVGGPPSIVVCEVKKSELRCEWASVASEGTMPETLKKMPKGQAPMATPSVSPHPKQKPSANEHAA